VWDGVLSTFCFPGSSQSDDYSDANIAAVTAGTAECAAQRAPPQKETVVGEEAAGDSTRSWVVWLVTAQVETSLVSWYEDCVRYARGFCQTDI
jgi:hypothetical protein